jgi:hypothetical protein
MQIEKAVLFMWRGKAYVPVLARYASGMYTSVDPVIVAGLNPDELTSAVRTVLAAGHPHLPNPTKEEVQNRKDPVLAAAKARSLREMMRTGASYSISWTNQAVRVDMSLRDKKGRWENDPAKARILPSDTSLEDIVSLILADARSRPELLGEATR